MVALLDISQVVPCLNLDCIESAQFSPLFGKNLDYFKVQISTLHGPETSINVSGAFLVCIEYKIVPTLNSVCIYRK